MKQILRRSFGPLLLGTLLMGCSKSSQDVPQPTAKATTADVVSWGMYTQTGSVQPEFMVDIAAIYRGRNSGDGTTGNLLLTLGQTKVAGGNKIWSFLQGQCLCGGPNTFSPYNSGRWLAIQGPNGGGAIKVASASGSWFVIDDQHQLWVSNSINYGSGTATWTKLPFLAVDIAGYGSYTYFLEATPVYGGHRIYRLTGSGASSVANEVLAGSAATALDVDELGRPWVVNSLTEVFIGPMPNSGDGFTLIPGINAYDIASTGTSISVISTAPARGGYSIYRHYIYAPNNYPWGLQPGDALQIAASQGDYGSFFVNNTLGEIFKGM